MQWSQFCNNPDSVLPKFESYWAHAVNTQPREGQKHTFPLTWLSATYKNVHFSLVHLAFLAAITNPPMNRDGQESRSPGGQILPGVVTRSLTVSRGPEIQHSLLMLTMHRQISPESYTVHIGSGGVLLRDTSVRVLQKCVCEREKYHTEYLASWVVLWIVHLLPPLDYYFFFFCTSWGKCK